LQLEARQSTSLGKSRLQQAVRELGLSAISRPSDRLSEKRPKGLLDLCLISAVARRCYQSQNG